MKRGKTHVAVAVRQPDGEINVDVRPVNSIADRYPILKKPFLRGVVSLVESLVMGMKALSYSAQVSGEEDEKLDSKDMALTIAVSAGLAILLFIIIPTWSMRFITDFTQDHMALNLAEGVLRMAIFLAYIAAISSMRDIQRVFQYHGAEHKTIYTYEAGLPLKVENVRPFSTLHPRCGTNFLMIVMLISMFIFTFLGWPNLVERIASRMSLSAMPVRTRIIRWCALPLRRGFYCKSLPPASRMTTRLRWRLLRLKLLCRRRIWPKNRSPARKKN